MAALCALGLAAGALGAGPARAAADLRLGPEASRQADRLARGALAGASRDARSLRVTTELAPDRITYLLRAADADRPVGALVLMARSRAPLGAERSTSFWLWRWADPAHPAAAEAVAALAEAVRARDAGPSPFVSPAAEVALHAGEPDPRDTAATLRYVAPQLEAVGVAVAAWLLALLLLRALGRPLSAPHVHVKGFHVLPVALQLTLFSYWWAYFPPVGTQLALIGFQLAFAFAFEALLAQTLRRPWRLGFGPVPVVLSANLFVWFRPDEVWLAYVLLAVALASKALLTDASGRHRFNPSALGLAAVGVLHLVDPQRFAVDDISNQLSYPPNMTEVIFFLALVAQYRAKITLVTLGALTSLAWFGLPEALCAETACSHGLWAPMFLVATLLATDPATIPRTGAGRLLSGLLMGWLIHATQALLVVSGYHDFFGKVLPIPVVNALAPAFDRAGALLTRPFPAVARALAGRWNLAHMAAYGVMVVAPLTLTDLKAELFGHVPIAPGEVPHLVVRGDFPTCDANPVFCRPFSFAGEVRMWLSDDPPPASTARQDRPPAPTARLVPPPAPRATPRGTSAPPTPPPARAPAAPRAPDAA